MLDIFVAKLGITTSISENLASLYTITLSPNPTTHQFNIASSKPIDELKITDVLGQLIYRAKPKDKNVVVEMEWEGIYFV